MWLETDHRQWRVEVVSCWGAWTNFRVVLVEGAPLRRRARSADRIWDRRVLRLSWDGQRFAENSDYFLARIRIPELLTQLELQVRETA